jgi:hypothetical protein
MAMPAALAISWPLLKNSLSITASQKGFVTVQKSRITHIDF